MSCTENFVLCLKKQRIKKDEDAKRDGWCRVRDADRAEGVEEAEGGGWWKIHNKSLRMKEHPHVLLNLKEHFLMATLLPALPTF